MDRFHEMNEIAWPSRPVTFKKMNDRPVQQHIIKVGHMFIFLLLVVGHQLILLPKRPGQHIHDQAIHEKRRSLVNVPGLLEGKMHSFLVEMVNRIGKKLKNCG